MYSPLLFDYLVSCSPGGSSVLFSHYAASLPELSEENRIFIKSTTGHIPLLLRPLLKMEEFDEVEFLESEINLLKTRITTFFRTMLTQEAVRVL